MSQNQIKIQGQMTDPENEFLHFLSAPFSVFFGT